MNRKFLHILSLVSLALLLFACQANDIDPIDELPDGVKAIELSLKVQNQSGEKTFRSAENGAKTRATEPGDQYNNAYGKELNENKIDNVEVFLFNADGSLKKRVPSSNLQQNGTDSFVILRILIPNVEISQYENQTFKVVAVANATAAIPATVASIADLQAVIQETADINKPDTPQPKFLMDGAIDVTPVWGANVVFTATEKLMLRRAASKIRLRIKGVDVKVTKDGSTVQYLMVGDPQVKLVRYTEKTSLLQGAPYAIQSGDWKTSVYRPMTPHTFAEMQNDADPDNITNSFLSASVPFYAYENDWSGNNNADETYLMVQIDFKAQTGGTDANPLYGSTVPYFYRIPVNYRMPMPGMTQEEIDGLYKLQRNHLYDVVSFIGILGSEDEGNPIEVDAFVAIQPWNEPDAVDGSISNAHYLVVKELHPLMPNIDYREVGYLSDLPITIKIDSTRYEYYDAQGQLYVIKNTGPFNDVTVTGDETDETNKLLKITHPVPINFVPFDIYFTVTHVMPANESGTPLSQSVRVTQYPPKYVTGAKSPAFAPNEGDTGPYADFRFHSPFGVMATNPVTNQQGPQINDVFSRITTVVNAGDEKIGDPTNPDGSTKSDAISNELISPEFIIASQNGMSQPVYQYSGGSAGATTSNFGAGYGPYSLYYNDISPYSSGYQSGGWQDNYRSYTNAANRCANYFEGEYGTNGAYTERYIDQYGRWASRTVQKTFKYQGRWRIPTAAELKYINDIQDNPNSAVKYLLWGQYYWSAQTNRAFNFNTNAWQTTTGSTPYVRCIFDTYKVDDK